MKKNILLTISLLCFSIVLMAQDDEKVKGAHPYKVSENTEVAQELSHWSLTPHIGFNYFDGDFNAEMKHAIAIPNAGLDLEYSFNPVWGLGLSYMYDMYTVTGKKAEYNADTLLNGHMHKAGLYVSMDFMNLFFPKAKRKICGIQAILGGGYAWYKSTTMYHDDYNELTGENPTHQRFKTAYYINEDGVLGPDYMTSYKGELYLQAGLNVEFNLNRTIALGVRATYNYFINDYIDGRGYEGLKSLASKNNDGIVDVTLNMRFKLMAVSKTHVRNVVSLDVAESKEKMKQVHDTVIIKHDSIIVREIITNKEKELKQIYYVYFNNNKDNLDDKALITIQQVADRMAEDTALYAVVTGYCDNTGSNKLNYALGDRRANNVISELDAEHGIASDHMYSTGLGKIVGRRSQAAYSPNRRAAIRLVDRETFERMKQDLDEKRNLREFEDDPNASETDEVQTVPLSETARPEKENEYVRRTHDEIVSTKSMTLSKLARKYYNNTYCWVYIYIANKDKISNPNNLQPGIPLIIPELTEEETRITKDASLRLYSRSRQSR